MARGSNTDVAPVATSAVVPSDLDEKALYLSDAGTSDAEADAKAIVARIVNAQTAEEVFGGPDSLLSAEDLLGVPFTLQDVEYRESDFEESAGAYAVLTISRWGQTATEMVTCGGRNVMAAAFRAKQLNALPRGPLTFVAGKQTRKGFTPLWLQDMDPDKANAHEGIYETTTTDSAGNKF